ncbi:hypothetical protein ESN35_07040 [Bifidobacterium pullorum subsp. gallinarum]|uniref:Uncharacterized protein n=1 Tax=Bifidobacterium pullorum subsp. gallinarum TaxID=78344 RepID=A0A4P6DT59_9BIFI|nr:hypothetical protein [Bifidobacterium pullorum]QAY33191.1 hypothetical protein ESN35_07040 [Bifidobacterium pullorum subsp. gallinarum]
MAELPGMNRLAHLLGLGEPAAQPGNHHLAGSKPLMINPLEYPARMGQIGALAVVQLIETLAFAPSVGPVNAAC